MKNQIVATKKFVSKHRVAIAVTITASAALALQMRTAREFNTFLKEQNLFDVYYTLDEV